MNGLDWENQPRGVSLRVVVENPGWDLSKNESIVIDILEVILGLGCEAQNILANYEIKKTSWLD